MHFLLCVVVFIGEEEVFMHDHGSKNKKAKQIISKEMAEGSTFAVLWEAVLWTIPPDSAKQGNQIRQEPDIHPVLAI